MYFIAYIVLHPPWTLLPTSPWTSSMLCGRSRIQLVYYFHSRSFAYDKILLCSESFLSPFLIILKKLSSPCVPRMPLSIFNSFNKGKSNIFHIVISLLHHRCESFSYGIQVMQINLKTIQILKIIIPLSS